MFSSYLESVLCAVFFFLSCSQCPSAAYWSTWWESVLSATLTLTLMAAKAALLMTTVTLTIATPKVSTAMEVMATLMEDTATVDTATPTAAGVEA